MKTLNFLLFTFVFLSGCQMAKKATSEKEALYEGQKWNTKRAITTIAFGSCDRQDLPPGYLESRCSKSARSMDLDRR